MCCVISSVRHLPTAGLTFYFFQARGWGRIRINLTSIHSCNSGGKEHRLVTELMAELRLHPMTNQQGSKSNLPYIALHQIQPTCHNPWQYHGSTMWMLAPFRIFLPWRRPLSPQKRDAWLRMARNMATGRQVSDSCFWLGVDWEGGLGSPRQDDSHKLCASWTPFTLSVNVVWQPTVEQKWTH